MKPLNFTPLAANEPTGYNRDTSRKLAFYVHGLSNLDAPVDEYRASIHNLEATGVDPKTAQVMQEYKEKYGIAKQDALVSIASDPSIGSDDKVQQAQAVANGTPIVDLEKEYMLEKAEQGNLPFWDILEVRTQQEQALNIAKRELETVAKEREERNWFGIGGGVNDAIGIMLPFANNELYVTLAEKMGVDISGLTKYALPGTVGREIRRKFLNTPAAERPMMIKELLTAIKEDAGYFDNSLLIREQAINDILGPLLDGSIDPESWTGWEVLNDTISLLDATVVWPMLKGGVKASGKLFGSSVGTVANADPAAASRLVKSAAENKEVADGLGLSMKDVTESVLPGVDPKNILHMADEEQLASELLRNAGKTSYLYTDDEIARATSTVREIQSTTDDVVFSPSGTTINMLSRDQGEQLSVYLNKEGKPFGSGVEAQMVAREHFAPGTYDIKRWTRDENVIADSVTGQGYHVIQVKDKLDIDFNRMKHDTLAFNDSNIFNSLTSMFVHAAPSSRLDKTWIGKAFESNRNRANFQKKFNDLFIPYQDLKKRMLKNGSSKKEARVAQQRVRDLWTQGSKEGEVYSVEKLTVMNNGYTRPEMEAYYAGIRLGEVQYVINNSKLYKRLVDDGYLTIKNDGADFMNVAKPYNKEKDGVARTMYDATNDRIIPVTANDSVATLKTKIRKDGESTFFVKLDDQTQLRTLTQTPLKHNQGYIPRYYDSLYFVTGGPAKGIHNGVEITDDVKGELANVLAGAESKAEADAMIKKLKSMDEYKDWNFSTRRDRNTVNDVDGVRFSEEEYQLQTARGNMFFKGRGSHLGKDKMPGLEGATKTIDPATSLIKSFSNMSYRAGFEDMAHSFTDRWIHDFGRFSGGKFPASVKEISSTDPDMAKEVAKARSYWRYINGVKGYRGPEAEIWRGAMLTFGEFVGNRGGKYAQKFSADLIKAGAKDPFMRGRGMAYNVMVAANPLRQLAIQTLQPLMLAGIDPKFILTGLPQLTAMRAAFWAKNAGRQLEYDMAIKAGSKTSGMSTKEFAQLVDDFTDSGLVAELADNTLAEGSAKAFGEVNSAESLAAKGYAKARGALSAPFQLGKNWGFSAGEISAKAGTYMIARRQWLKKNPGKVINTAAKAEIANMTDVLTFSMSNMDKLSYQNGMVGLVMQFFQVQHKALGLVLPNIIGGTRFLDGGQKARLFAGQILMYGGGFLGLDFVANKLIDSMDLSDEIRPEVAEAVKGGMLEYMINSALDEDISVVSSLSPTMGMYDSITKLLGYALTDEGSVLEAMPLSHVYGRMRDTLQTIHKWKKYGEWSPDQMTMFIDTIFSMASSGYRNASQAVQMMKYQQFVDKYGNPTHREMFASKWDALAKAGGFESYAVKDIRKANEDKYNSAQEVRDIADDLYQYARKQAASTDTEIGDIIMMMDSTIRLGYTPDQAQAISNELMIKFYKSESTENPFDIYYNANEQGKLTSDVGMEAYDKLYREGKLTKEQYEYLKGEMNTTWQIEE